MKPYARFLRSGAGGLLRSKPLLIGLLNKLNLERVDHKALKRRAQHYPVDRREETFALVRVIGNDLFPRHRIGQNRENLDFILREEEPFPKCEKIWVLNRIFDRSEENAIIELLNNFGAKYLRIPFNREAYRSIGWVKVHDAEPRHHPEIFKTARYALKNAYVMNNNGARNVALSEGQRLAKWTLPWDGNCFMRSDAWARFTDKVKETNYLKHFVVPMWRPSSRKELLEASNPLPTEEPQLVFRYDALSRFNPQFVYGRRPKVEMLWHLGIPGPWDFWRDERWEPQRRGLSDEAFEFGYASWVARVPSGHPELEQPTRQSFLNRGKQRNEAIRAMIDRIDQDLKYC